MLDLNMYICLTCHGHLKKQSEPPQALWNKLDIVSPTEIFSNLNRLQRVSISRRILFKKVSIMSKGRFPKLKGSIFNKPIEIDDITNVLPPDANSNGLLIVKLTLCEKCPNTEFFLICIFPHSD